MLSAILQVSWYRYQSGWVGYHQQKDKEQSRRTQIDRVQNNMLNIRKVDKECLCSKRYIFIIRRYSRAQ